MGWAVSTTPRPLYPQERPGTHCTGGWVGPRACLDGCGKYPPTGIRSPDRPVRSESLYRLSYPGRQREYGVSGFQMVYNAVGNAVECRNLWGKKIKGDEKRHPQYTL